MCHITGWKFFIKTNYSFLQIKYSLMNLKICVSKLYLFITNKTSKNASAGWTKMFVFESTVLFFTKMWFVISKLSTDDIVTISKDKLRIFLLSLSTNLCGRSLLNIKSNLILLPPWIKLKRFANQDFAFT